MTCCGLNLKAVVRLVTYWQNQLGLQDWDIGVGLVGDDDLPGESGMCDFVAERKAAKILIHAERQDNLQELHDTIIHELLHLLFWFVPLVGIKRMLMEQAFERICPVVARKHVETLPRKARK